MCERCAAGAAASACSGSDRHRGRCSQDMDMCSRTFLMLQARCAVSDDPANQRRKHNPRLLQVSMATRPFLIATLASLTLHINPHGPQGNGMRTTASNYATLWTPPPRFAGEGLDYVKPPRNKKLKDNYKNLIKSLNF